MNYEELSLHYDLLELPGMGHKSIKALLETFGLPSAIVSANEQTLRKVDGLSSKLIKGILKLQPTKVSDHKEIAFIRKHHIQVLTPYYNNFPQRLLPLDDAPSLLYFKGNASINHARTVAIIGTRNNSDYGKIITQEIVKQLANHSIQIISGLAEGIDGVAHKAALDNHLPTIGVLGHGLNTLFPASHKKLAKNMLDNGGLLTEYPSSSIPIPANFPMRNRIVAGMSDMILIIETKEKGGSMITAHLGFNYNKEVGAIPGAVQQGNSKGCNLLIKTNVASLIESGDDILKIMNWEPNKKRKSVQRELFIHLDQQEQAIMELLQKENQLHFDELLHKTQLTYSSLNNYLLQLEMRDLISSLPGKIFQSNAFI